MLRIEFSDKQKQKIRKIHNARCVLCGLGEKEGAGSHVVSRVPRQDGGEAVISNGQILCTKHKNARFDAEKIDPKTDSGKNFIISMHGLAKDKKSEHYQEFFAKLLKVYKAHNIDKHIAWKK